MLLVMKEGALRLQSSSSISYHHLHSSASHNMFHQHTLINRISSMLHAFPCRSFAEKPLSPIVAWPSGLDENRAAWTHLDCEIPHTMNAISCSAGLTAAWRVHLFVQASNVSGYSGSSARPASASISCDLVVLVKKFALTTDHSNVWCRSQRGHSPSLSTKHQTADWESTHCTERLWIYSPGCTHESPRNSWAFSSLAAPIAGERLCLLLCKDTRPSGGKHHPSSRLTGSECAHQ